MVLLKFTSVPVTSKYGPRPRFTVPHKGVDTANGSKYPHSVFGDGVVTFAGRHPWRIINRHPDYERGIHVIVNHAPGIDTSYHSLSKLNVKAGQRVKMGDIIGWAGTSAVGANGDHVHNGLWFNGNHVDPLKHLKPGVVVDVTLPGAQAPVAVPAATPASNLLPDKDHEMYVLRNQKDGGCYMVGRKRLVHLGTTKDLTAARKVFEFKDLDDHAFRLALIAFSVPYPAAVKGGNFEGA